MDCHDEASTTDTASVLEQGTINDKKAPPKIGAKEDGLVNLSRLLVIVVLLLSTLCTCMFVLVFMSEQEQSNFESDVSISC